MPNKPSRSDRALFLLAAQTTSETSVASTMIRLFARTGTTVGTVSSATAVFISMTEPIIKQGGSLKRNTSRMRDKDGNASIIRIIRNRSHNIWRKLINSKWTKSVKAVRMNSRTQSKYSVDIFSVRSVH